MFAVLLFIVLYYGPKWFNVNGFVDHTKIYKLDEGYYLTIKGERAGSFLLNLSLFMHNDWIKFKEMIDTRCQFFVRSCLWVCNPGRGVLCIYTPTCCHWRSEYLCFVGGCTQVFVFFSYHS